MNFVQFTSTLKPDGKEYKKIVYWNRYIRMKGESLFLIFVFICGILVIATQKELYKLIIGALGICFPIMVIMQFNSSIAYHLKNRDKTESMPCKYTIMQNGILTEIPEENYSKLYKWEDSTKVYNRLGYYMFFNKNDMTVMISKSDVAKEDLQTLKNLIKNGMGPKKCSGL